MPTTAWGWDTKDLSRNYSSEESLSTAGKLLAISSAKIPPVASYENIASLGKLLAIDKIAGPATDYYIQHENLESFGSLLNILKQESPIVGDSAFTNSIIQDMQGINDGIQLEVQRTVYACTHMGLMARGDYSPTFWHPADKTLKNATWWTAMVGWWNSIPLQGNTATQTKLEIGKIAVIGRSRDTKKWSVLYVGPSGWAAIYNAFASAQVGSISPEIGTIPNYHTKLYLLPANSNTLHGGSGRLPINAQALDGLVSCTAARIVGPDVANAKYALWQGADWYPHMTFNVAANPPGWIPAVYTSRLKKLTTSWQLFCAAPLDIPGRANQQRYYPVDTSRVFLKTSDIIANPIPAITGILPP